MGCTAATPTCSSTCRARRPSARRGPTVITFDHHPDEVLTGTAPPLLIHPDERLERLAAAGVEVTVVQHFDEAVRRTTYDAFVATIQARTALAGLLMTPTRRSASSAAARRMRWPRSVARDGFDVVVVPPFTLDGRSVRSSDIRAAIAAGDLRRPSELLGRPVDPAWDRWTTARSRSTGRSPCRPTATTRASSIRRRAS